MEFHGNLPHHLTGVATSLDVPFDWLNGQFIIAKEEVVSSEMLVLKESRLTNGYRGHAEVLMVRGMCVTKEVNSN